MRKSSSSRGMGALHFQVYPPQRVTPDACARAYFVARDRFMLPSRIRPTSDGFIVERTVADSGYFHIPWQIDGKTSQKPGDLKQCELTLGTAWVMERAAPYHLQVELARGKVNQLRNQTVEWQSVGLAIPPEVQRQVDEASHLFYSASTSQHEPVRAAQLAEQAIAAAIRAGDVLATCYGEQALAARLRSGQLDVWLGAHLGFVSLPPPLRPIIGQSFNSCVVPVNWHDIEATERTYDWSTSDELMVYAREQKLAVCGGPLISFDDANLPAWLCLWEGDFDNLLSCVSEFVERAVKRYRGRFHLWHAASRLNVGEGLGLSTEDRVRIAVRIVEIIHSLDPTTPFILSFDQPWAEYTSREDHEPPLYLADTIIRSGLGVSGIGLEINLGYSPGGSYLRDILEMHQLLDLWNLLGLPLYLFLTIPSSSADDPQAVGEGKVVDAFTGGWTPAIQQALMEKITAQVLTRPSVRGVFWNQLSDAGPHTFPNGGLCDKNDKPKPVLQSLAKIRQAVLK